ncbi:zona pellucida protein AX 4 [Chanos chanos]|uniref:Zona pellucida protein AX 4 n=1 Tax=Chanos chanos TaxID=29144 RepID=A0A6J2VPX1_CHACN|nr:uncharacterized protein LOC115816172 [Chanos chanos]
MVTRTSMAVPPVEPSQTSLLDSTCRPKEVDQSRVPFTFIVNTCGTKVRTESNHVVYENEVVFHREFAPHQSSVITRDSDLRLTVRCHYPVTKTTRLYTDHMSSNEPWTMGAGSIIEMRGGPTTKGAFEVECTDRYLLISVPLPSSGLEPHFEAVDVDGFHLITQQYGSECGYTYSVLPLLGRVFLRASYFSCHADNQNDEVFTFKFKLITVDREGEESTLNISKTCSLTLPWAPREVICEENYMEVSVKSDLPCPYTGTFKEDLTTALSVAQGSAVSAWQVMFLGDGHLPEAMSTEEASNMGYFLDATTGRVVFRSSYGQRHSVIEMINGLAVEVLRPTIFFRQRWMVIMVDLVVACTLNDGSFDGASLSWETPMVVAPLVSGLPGFESQQIRVGMNGQLLDEQTAIDHGYTIAADMRTVEISVPYAAEGAFRKSFVMENVYHEFHLVQLRYEHVFVDDSGVETRHNQIRPLVTPLLDQHPFTVNQTVLKERIFTVFVGNFPFDVELVTVVFNGYNFTLPDAIERGYSITKIPFSNNTHGYTVKVPFEDSVVTKMYLHEGVLQYSLDINYTLSIMPKGEQYYHLASVVADIKDVFPPAFSALCTDSGISFKLDHTEFDYLWEVCIGQYPLTQQLADHCGYIMHNDSQTLTLNVPLFTTGYIYENITLQQFFGTFEVISRDAKSLEIVQSTAKRCPFNTSELIVCSTSGVMTVVSDVSKAVPEADHTRITLLDKTCKPKQMDENRVLFTFGLNTCGTRVLVNKLYVTYENEIVFDMALASVKKPVVTRELSNRLIIKCVYPVHGINRLFVDRKFRAEAPGMGSIQQPKIPMKGK